MGFETDMYLYKFALPLKCKFTPLGFETFSDRLAQNARFLCKFTPLGFETPSRKLRSSHFLACKFTPLGFETRLIGLRLYLRSECKFTPLGFETRDDHAVKLAVVRVNLPRWGLKQLNCA